MIEEIIQIKNLKKSFENHEALKGVSLDIHKGVIFGLLGPNGAGKTTLIRNLTQIYRPDSGEIFFNGEKLQPKHIANIGYMPEERGLYKKMKIGEQLIYLARLKGLSVKDAKDKVNKWMDHFDIQSWKNKKTEDLSKGMQQKVQFIATILHEPDLLILDEPYSGLDPINANLIKDEMLKLRDQGSTIIFSTHRMESIEELCEEIALINNGEIILQGKVKEIKEENKQNIYQIQLGKESVWDTKLNNKYAANQVGENTYQIYLQQHNTNELLKEVMASGATIVGFNETLPTINEIFIQKVKAYTHE